MVTDAETIATRTDQSECSTETSKEQRAAAALADQQENVLADAQAKLDELIGLAGPKEQITVWRTEIQMDRILAARSKETSSSHENHMVLEGPPGTAKTSFARIAAEFLFGLGKIERPTVVEVTEEDLGCRVHLANRRPDEGSVRIRLGWCPFSSTRRTGSRLSMKVIRSARVQSTRC